MSKYENEYPLAMYDPKRPIGDGNPLYAHTKKQRDQMDADGLVTFANYPEEFRSWPRLLYHPNGTTTAIVKNAAQMQEFVDNGYLVKAPDVKKVVPQAASVPQNDPRVDDLEMAVEELKQQIDESNKRVDSQLSQILNLMQTQAASTPKKPKKEEGGL